MATYVIDANHSSAEFAVRHMMVTWVVGFFNKISGTVSFDPLNLAASAAEVEIDAAAIYTVWNKGITI